MPPKWGHIMNLIYIQFLAVFLFQTTRGLWGAIQFSQEVGKPINDT